MLDTTGYLSSFGWQGKGNGLRQGSVSRPLAIPQKRTLSGLGKDRDEAFPFWDHLFAAASKSIKIKISGDEDEAEDDDIALSRPFLLRTTTGILSNRRPASGTPAGSGTVTPTELSLPRLGLVATAKRESARKRLYAGFLRGPVLGLEVDRHPGSQLTSVTSNTVATQTLTSNNTVGQINDKKRRHEDHEPGDKAKRHKKSSKSKQKQKDTCPNVIVAKERKKKRHEDDIQATPEGREVQRMLSSQDRTETAEEKRQRKAAKLARRKRKEERRNAKEMNKE